MGFYDRHILPHLLNAACRAEAIMEQRAKVVPKAKGRVLEVGAGSGLNLRFYDPALVDSVICLEPSAELWAKARPWQAAVPVEHIQGIAEDMPVDDASVDTIVLTYTLCTIPDALRALGSMRRTLKPGGALLFCEHGAAPDAGVAKWQRRINPVWRVIGGGCNLNRPIPDLIAQGGFHIAEMQTGYLPDAPRIAAYNYWGEARAAA
jgi:ubiquinone/menaquinone biosynthesis C-methylase UbiE